MHETEGYIVGALQAWPEQSAGVWERGMWARDSPGTWEALYVPRKGQADGHRVQSPGPPVALRRVRSEPTAQPWYAQAKATKCGRKTCKESESVDSTDEGGEAFPARPAGGKGRTG